MSFTVDFYEESRKNVRKTIVLVMVFLAMMIAFGLIIDLIFGILPVFTFVFLAIALVQTLISLSSGKDIVLKSVKAREARTDDPEERQLRNIVDELSLAAGMAKPPEIYVIDDDSVINAFATGRKQENSVVCVTTGLLKSLDREETSGVIGHELSHIVNRDILLMTLISALLGAVVIVQSLAFRALIAHLRFGAISATSRTKRSSKKNDNSALAIIAFLAAVAGLGALFSFIGRLSLLAVSRTREYFADARAVELTRNPSGLSRALRKIVTSSAKLQTANVATAHLFISDPLKRRINNKSSFFASLWSTHPPIAMRISILENRSLKEIEDELSDYI
ncbi:M48 family metalloprotease [Mesotoga sp. H07.pep.5.3]|uniref:M48 family metalloprotease n=1 Tax=Mesotoga sp. H07.pep.5.3 TaxID=1421003 RepID=UPI000C175FA2|nr:M48 family metalloprotease [Mesotoga sp. H07.pep.5.3]PIJ60873.1 peptidase M48 [Mesotoga sp. H07.pep.5.3]